MRNVWRSSPHSCHHFLARQTIQIGSPGRPLLYTCFRIISQRDFFINNGARVRKDSVVIFSCLHHFKKKYIRCLLLLNFEPRSLALNNQGTLQFWRLKPFGNSNANTQRWSPPAENKECASLLSKTYSSVFAKFLFEFQNGGPGNEQGPVAVFFS